MHADLGCIYMTITPDKGLFKPKHADIFLISPQKCIWCELFSWKNKNIEQQYPTTIELSADNSVKIWWNLPISNLKPDLHNINAHTKLGENPLRYTQVIIKKGKTDGQLTEIHKDTQTSNLKP